jgi:hypothetical protein
VYPKFSRRLAFNSHHNREATIRPQEIEACRLVGEIAIRTINRTPVPGSDFGQDNPFTAQPFASDMLTWLDGCEHLCNGVLQSQEQAEWVWQEIMAGTKNDPERRDQSKADTIPSSPHESRASSSHGPATA